MRAMTGQEKNKEIQRGRESQKNRTRKALAAAAESLIRAGRKPTVSEAAEAAGISRATAYRYFPTQEMLWAEVALFTVGGPLSPVEAGNPSVSDAVGNLVRHVGTWAYANEQPLRTLLRLSLDPSTGVRRPGHRVEWIAETLEPVRNEMDSKTYRRLSHALTLMLGIDPVVVMNDIAQAPRDQALDALEWSARALVETALNNRTQSSKSPTQTSRARGRGSKKVRSGA